MKKIFFVKSPRIHTTGPRLMKDPQFVLLVAMSLIFLSRRLIAKKKKMSKKGSKTEHWTKKFFL